MMGLDWRILDLPTYVEALEAYNAIQNPDASPASEYTGDKDALDRVMSARVRMEGGGKAPTPGAIASPASSGAARA